MRVLLSGGTGFIGRRLLSALQNDRQTVTVVTCGAAAADLPAEARIFQGDTRDWRAWRAALENQDAVIHLAGEPVGPARWTAAKKKRIRDSRVLTTAALAQAAACCWPPGLAFTAMRANAS